MSGIFNSTSLGRNSANRFLRPSSSPSSSDQAGALTPSTSHPLGGGPDSSPETTLHPLPYAPRRRTPGGSISSLPGHSSTGTVGAGGAGSSMSSPTTTSATTTIPPLFSNPVTPTISTSQLDSTDVIQDSPVAGSVSSPSVATSEGSNGGAIARGSSPAGGGGGDTDDAGSGTSSTVSTTAGNTSPALSRTTSLKDRLKLTSLKAEAQRGVGLGNDSLGMKMLETLVAKGGERAWEEVKDLVLVKRLTLLLPFATPASSVEITPEVVREHLVFATGGTSESSETTPALVVTLSGLVGTMSSDALTFCSFIPANGPIMARLMDPASRSVTLAHLTIPPINFTQQQSPSFPTLTPLLYSSVLPFPPPIPIAPTSTSSSLFPPSLTSRPRAVSAALPASATRISNPFAGFFGSRAAPVKSAPPERQPTPPPPTSPSSVEKEIPVVVEPEATELSSGTTTGTGHPPRRASSAAEYIPASSPSSPTSPSVTSSDAARATVPSTTDKPRDDVLISAWGVDRPLKRADMEKATGRALREWMTKELEGLPTGIVAAVKRFASFPHPPASQSRSHPSVTPTLSSKSNSKVPAVPTLSTFPPPSTWSDPEVCSSTYQAFFTLVYNDLYAVYAKESYAVEGEDKTAAERREREVEKRALEGVDRVERVLLGLGHNLLFSPPTSNDPKHDAALASRIAALNMLDLSLGHLGVVTTHPDGTLDEEVVQGLDEIVKAVGKEFTKLQAPSCQSPKAQTQVLVRAHQLVIERLRELPAIRLRPEGEPYKPPVAASEASESEDGRVPPGIPSPPTVTSPPFSPTKATLTRSEKKPADGEVGRPTTTTTDEERTPRGSTSLELTQPELEEVPALVLEEPAEDDKEEEEATTEASKAHGVESEGEHSVAVGEAMGDSVLLPAKPERKETEDEKVAPSSASVRSVASSTGGDREKGGASGADLLLPIIIFSVVKANPFRLVSHLLYIQRYRASMCFSGEASYALVNITAVVEFLENVDPASLGLGGSDKVLAVGELAPIDPDLQRDLSSISAATTGSAAQVAAAQSRLRGKVSAVGELAVSGVNNVVGSGLGALRSLVNTGHALGGAAAEGLLVQLPGGVVGDMGGGAGGAGGATRPGGPPRRASAFSIASLTASVAGIGSRERSASGSALLGGSIGSTMGGGAGGSASSVGAGSSNSSIASSRTASEWGPRREMVEVSSRPGSIYEREDDSDDDDERDRGMRSSDDDDAGPADTRSLRSVRSVASSRRSSSYMPPTNVGNPSAGQERSERMSISERFARLGSGSGGGASTLEAGSPNSSSTSLPKAGLFATVATSSSPIPSPPSPTPGSLPLTRGASSQSRRASLLGGGASTFHTPPPPATSTSSPQEDVVAGPNKRFLECRAGELRIDEVAELLLEYKRLAGVLKEVGVWD